MIDRDKRKDPPATPAKRSQDGKFLMTPEQYQKRAASLRALGSEQLAQQYDNLVKARSTSAKPDELLKKLMGVKWPMEPDPEPTKK